MTTSGPVLRFLVAEDDRIVRDLLVRMIEQLGHFADEACDGVEAVEALVFGRYDILLLDLAMPRMAGQEVLRWLRTHTRYSVGLRVVVLSALVGTGADESTLPGVDLALPKPLSGRRLRELVEETLTSSAPAPAGPGATAQGTAAAASH